MMSNNGCFPYTLFLKIESLINISEKIWKKIPHGEGGGGGRAQIMHKTQHKKELERLNFEIE